MVFPFTFKNVLIWIINSKSMLKIEPMLRNLGFILNTVGCSLHPHSVLVKVSGFYSCFKFYLLATPLFVPLGQARKFFLHWLQGQLASKN